MSLKCLLIHSSWNLNLVIYSQFDSGPAQMTAPLTDKESVEVDQPPPSNGDH